MECYYFGTFNPVHIGHIKTAFGLINKLGFSKVVFIPSYSPCHKNVTTSAKDRFNMLKLLENNNLKVSDIEFKLPEPSYSFQTVKELLREKKPGEKINYVIGYDAFKKIETWKNAEYLKVNIHFVVLKREGERREEIEKLRQRGYDFTIADEIDKINVSSSEIREKIQRGAPVSDLIDEKVKRYIDENRLYRKNS